MLRSGLSTIHREFYKFFAFLNSTEDNDTLFFYGEVVPQTMIDAAPIRLTFL